MARVEHGQSQHPEVSASLACGSDPRVWISSCFFSQAINREVDQKVVQPELELSRIWDGGITCNGLKCYTTMPVPNINSLYYNYGMLWTMCAVTGHTILVEIKIEPLWFSREIFGIRIFNGIFLTLHNDVEERRKLLNMPFSSHYLSQKLDNTK